MFAGAAHGQVLWANHRWATHNHAEAFVSPFIYELAYALRSQTSLKGGSIN